MNLNAAILKRELPRISRKSARKWPALLVLFTLLLFSAPEIKKAAPTDKARGAQTLKAGFGGLIEPGLQTLPIPPLTKLPTPIRIGGDSSFNQKISAQAFVVFDRTSGQVLLAKNPHQKLPPASLTKIVTALAVLQNSDLNQKVAVSSEALEKSGGSLMGLRVNESISVENLLWGLLLNSGNDAGYVLGQSFKNGYFDLVEQMNQLVSFLGLKNTHFQNTVGFDEPGHYSSAYDLTQLANLALRQPIFARLVSTRERTVTGLIPPDSDNLDQETPQKIWHHLQNTNPLLGQVKGAAGVKTGWTPQAKECLLTYLKTEQGEFLITVMGSENREKDTQLLIDLLNAN